MELAQHRTLALVGLPGAGKTTVSLSLARELGWNRLSTGDALRQIASTDPELGSQLSRGMLGPEATVAELVRRFLTTAEAPRVIDGYPRHLAQLEWLRQFDKSPRFVYLSIPRAVARERLLQRGRFGERPEDNEDTIDRRLDDAERNLDAMLPSLVLDVVEVDAANSQQSVIIATLNALRSQIGAL